MLRGLTAGFLGYRRGKREREQLDYTRQQQEAAAQEAARRQRIAEALQLREFEDRSADRARDDVRAQTALEQAKAQQAALAQYRESQEALARERLEETRRSNRAREARPAGGSGGYTAVRDAQIQQRIKELVAQGTPLERANRQARMEQGMSPGMSVEEMMRAGIFGGGVTPNVAPPTPGSTGDIDLRRNSTVRPR